MPSRHAHAYLYSSEYESPSLGLTGLPLGFVPASMTKEVVDSGFYYDSAAPQYETGWIPDYANGGIRYVSGGRVQEVDDEGNPVEDDDELENISCPPAPRMNAWELAPLTPLLQNGSTVTLVDYPEALWQQNTIADQEDSVFASQQKTYSPNRPRRRSSTASFGARHHTKPYPAQSPRFPLSPKYFGLDNTVSQEKPSASSSQELHYAILQVQFLAFYFQSQAPELDINEYIVRTCEHIADMLHKLDRILSRPNHDQSHLKSLHRTIKRLTSVAEHRPSSWSHCKKILDKLCEHQAKLSSLLKKLTPY